jgi:hypothetical protein
VADPGCALEEGRLAEYVDAAADAKLIRAADERSRFVDRIQSRHLRGTRFDSLEADHGCARRQTPASTDRLVKMQIVRRVHAARALCRGDRFISGQTPGRQNDWPFETGRKHRMCDDRVRRGVQIARVAIAETGGVRHDPTGVDVVRDCLGRRADQLRAQRHARAPVRARIIN